MGIGIGMLTLLTLTALFAWLIGQEIIMLDWMNYLAALILIAASFIGGMIGKSGTDRGTGALIAGAVIWLLLLGVNAAVYDCNAGGAPETALIILGGSGTAVLTGNKRSRRGIRRHGNRRR